MAKYLINTLRTTRSMRNTFYCCSNFNDRFLHTNKLNQASDIRKTIYKNEEVKKMRLSIIGRYLEYVRNYEQVIEKKFPTAMHLYRTFKIGMKEFYSDIKTYMKIIGKLNLTTEGLKTLTRNEIEIYFKMPRDMIKVAPVLFLLALPGTNYIIFPVTYYFPRQFLCSHFWTIQQRSEFNVYYLKKRLLNNRSTLRCLQAELKGLKGHRLYFKWRHILGLLGSGVQPNTLEILHIKELFATSYHLKNLKGNHIKSLLKIHDRQTLWFRRSKLIEHAKLLRAMDRAIVREGGVKSLSQENLKTSCFIRGLNPINMKTEDIEDWLQQWLNISQEVDHDSLSLLLHCPILLGYNQPSNWLLIY